MKYILKIVGVGSIILYTVTLLAINADDQLSSAVLEYNCAQVKQALDNGAVINKIVQDESGMTFLDSVISYAYLTIQFIAPHKSIQVLEIVELLLEKGADINVPGYWGYTPLMMAPASAEIVELLLRYGANPEIANTQGISALDSARHYYPDIYKLFLFYPPLLKEAQEHPNQEILCQCIEKEYFTLVKLLITQGVTVTLSDVYRAKAVYERIKTLRSQIIFMLLHDKLTQEYCQRSSYSNEPLSKKAKLF